MSVTDNRAGLRGLGPTLGSGLRGDAGAQPSQIRLLKFVTVFGFGGTERQIVNLSRMIDRSRFDLRLGCLRRRGEFLAEIEENQIPVSEYKIKSFYNAGTLRQQMRLAGDIRRQRIQIVHSYNFYANTFTIPAAWLAGTPVTVASIRDLGIYLTPVQKRVQKFLCRWVDCILVNAEAIRRWLVEEGYPPDKITVIRNGIDLSRFASKNGGGNLHRELGLPGRAPLVVMLSRLNPQKGIEYFLEAAASVSRRCPKARFLVVGDAFVRRNGVVERDVAYQRELRRSATRLGLGQRVVFTGFRPDVPELLSGAAVSVLPSVSEGLSNTLLESMAAAVPVVATRVGGNPEVIEDGKGGVLVPPRDPRALAEAICAILKNRSLARSLGEEGRRRVAERFSLDRMVRETQDLYVGLLEKKTKGRRPAASQITR